MHYTSILTNDEIQRYSRQIILPQFRPHGQLTIRTTGVLIVGLGGLGSPVLMYLASAGFKHIGIVDYDDIELHNLQRQVIHTEKMIDKKKVESAANFVKGLNSTIDLKIHDCFFSESNAEKIITEYDLIIDCTDNIKTRYIISDSAKVLGKHLILGSVLKWEGQVYVLPKDGPCYRCLFPEMRSSAQNCDEAGVVGAACGLVGSLQVCEAIKLVLNETSSPKLIVVNALNTEMNTFDLKRKSKCNVCDFKIIQVPVNAEVKAPPRMESIDDKYKIKWKDYLENTKLYDLVDIRPDHIYEICHIKNSTNMDSKLIEKDPGIMKRYKKKIVLLCRKGITAKKIANLLIKNKIECLVLEGGLKKFKEEIDSTFPLD